MEGVSVRARSVPASPVCVSPIQVLLKLFSYCVKVKVNRQQLVKLEMNTLNVMLGTLNLVRSLRVVSKSSLHPLRVQMAQISFFPSWVLAMVGDHRFSSPGFGG